MSKARRYLLDVNVLVALLDEDHSRHAFVLKWFSKPGRQWAICPFTEAGLLRHMTTPKTGDLSMDEATAMLARLAEEPGYSYHPIAGNWMTLCSPFSRRLFGHNQNTDAYLLGLAVKDGLVLVTFDKAILHLAGQHGRHVLVL